MNTEMTNTDFITIQIILNPSTNYKFSIDKTKPVSELKEKLILNHIIIIYNLFGVQAATKLLFFKLKDYYSYLKPFLVMLEVCPDKVAGIGIENATINISDIPMDANIVNVLREIKNDRQS